ncbi:MAG: hypothetical protein ACYCZB_17785 [Acidiphilium sp.]
MSGTTEPALPATITITQSGVIPQVIVADGAIGAPPVGVPPYPLATDPSQTWWLTYANGALAWVEQPDAPSNSIFALEDAQGFLLLEDGVGAILMEL